MTFSNLAALPSHSPRKASHLYLHLLLAVVLSVGSASAATTPTAPGTPAPDLRPAPAAPIGASSGNGSWHIGSATGLYVVDPAVGEIALQGATPGSIPLISVTLNKGIPPASTTVTLNGVELMRWAGNPLLQWTVDPAGPQPIVGSGGFIDLVASDGGGRQREMVLPCPSDIAMLSTPAIGSSLAGSSSVQLTFGSTIVLNLPGIPGLAGVFPSATLMAYNPGSGAIVPGALGQAGAGQLGVTVPIGGRPATGAYLMDVRWPGLWQIDGETGTFCGLAKRWTYTNSTVAVDPRPIIVNVFPGSGAASGGENVRIDGAALSGVTTATFDSTAATIVSRSDASITVTAPAHQPGTVTILLSSPGGMATSTYIYLAPEVSKRHRAARH